MPARLQTLALVGLGTQPVTVEVDLAAGLPSFTVVGLPDKAVDESRERVRAAIRNAGFQFPVHRITVNLAPADIPKVGPAFDLPIALAILVASNIIPNDRLDGIYAVGELSLNGDIQPVDGTLPMMLSLKPAPPVGLILPAANAEEARLVDGVPIAPASNLRNLVELLVANQLNIAASAPAETLTNPTSEQTTDLAAIAGLEQVKRALTVAAAGNHNVLLVGPPGTGKTLLARAYASILPHLTTDEHLEVLTIRSAAGLLRADELRHRNRPIRHPHHTASPVAIVGGGTKLRPGEVSLAHRGVLFLDEMPEFPRAVLEALREPLEDGQITVARARGTTTFPARFTLIAAANPCPCGYYADPEKPCRCSPTELARYQKKLSGPLIDRIDLVVTVPRQSTEALLDQPTGTSSIDIRQHVETARRRQANRHKLIGGKTNSELTAPEIKAHIQLSDPARDILVEAGARLHLSGRALHRLLKVARTIADLAEAETVDVPHLAEALQYRQVDTLQA